MLKGKVLAIFLLSQLFQLPTHVIVLGQELSYNFASATAVFSPKFILHTFLLFIQGLWLSFAHFLLFPSLLSGFCSLLILLVQLYSAIFDSLTSLSAIILSYFRTLLRLFAIFVVFPLCLSTTESFPSSEN